MDQRRLGMSDFTVGEPLPWDVYDDSNKLLLRRGHIVESAGQVAALLERGLFVNAGPTAIQLKKDAQASKREAPSALRIINLVHQRLERLLYNLPNETDAQAKVLDVAKALRDAVDINADVAIASVLLNQEAASYAVRHCTDTALIALIVARAMNKTQDEIQSIMSAALTMNVSMLRQQDHLENKQGPLSEKEAELIRNHAHESAEMLRQIGISDPAWLSYVQLHHENNDDSGTLGKKTREIPQNAWLLALADRFCASIANRAYRKTLLPNSALRDVLLAGGKASDPMLSAYFVKELGNYPPGTVVRLRNGEIGVVTRRMQPRTNPIVHAFIGPRGEPFSFPLQRDTATDTFTIREAISRQEATVRFSMQQLWGDTAAL